MREVFTIRIYSGGVLFASGLGSAPEKTIMKRVLSRVGKREAKLTRVSIRIGSSGEEVNHKVVYLNEKTVRINGNTYRL